MALQGLVALDVFQEVCTKVASSYHSGVFSTISKSINGSSNLRKSSETISHISFSSEAATVLANGGLINNIEPSSQLASEVLKPEVLKKLSPDGSIRGLERALLDFTGQRVTLQQTRGFRSRRAIGVGAVSLEPSNFLQRAFEKLKKPAQSKRLDDMTNQFSGQPEVQDKLKIAFAEGYRASDGSSQKPGGMEKFLRLASYIITIWLMFIVIRLVSSGSGGRGGGLSFMSSNESYEVNPEVIRTSFDDVKGADEALHELKEIVEFLRNPEAFHKVGAKLPKGVLLVGPPGNGKVNLHFCPTLSSCSYFY